jgi:DNA polymerase
MTLMLLGEAWGKEEELANEPFVGPSGKILNGMLAQVGINRKECYITNVFNFRPKPTNDVKHLCGPKAGGIPGMPSVGKGGYVRSEFTVELTRLYREIDSVRPTLIVALGATAAWSVLKTTGIRSIRGAPWQSFRGPKVLPTYHPAAIMREWKLRPIVLADLHKATQEARYPEIRRPSREIWIEPTLEDLQVFEEKYIVPSSELSIDIETAGDQITCIGFAPSVDRAIVVPFFDYGKSHKNYWPTLEDELKAWAWVRRMCEQYKPTMVGQNILYDINFLWTKYGIRIPHLSDDSMLLHHALQPEMEKSLGFLGSVYTNEAAWKTEYKQSKTAKRED